MADTYPREAMGPLDLMDDAVKTAERYDDMLLRGTYSPEEMRQIRLSVEGLDQLTPLIGKLVLGKGTILTQMVDGEGDIVGYTPSVSQVEVKGIYRGFALANCLVSLGEDELFVQPRAVHYVEGDPYTFRDSDFSLITARPTERFLVSGSIINPLESYDAHSLRQLYDDELTAEIDQLLFNNTEINEVISTLYDLLVPVGLPANEHLEMLRQRLSYINSLAMFENVSAVTEIVINNFQNFPDEFNVLIPGLGSFYVDTLYGVEVAHDFLIEDGNAASTESFTLYLRGFMDGYGEVMIPFRESLALDYQKAE